MKAEIQTSKTALQTALVYIKHRNIYVTEDIRLIRSQGTYPAIGIKDGATGFATLSSDQDDENFSITFVAYVQLFKPEAGVMGSGVKKGVLDIATDIIDTLRNNDLGGLVESAMPSAQGESQIINDDNLAILMVPITMQYTRFDTY